MQENSSLSGTRNVSYLDFELEIGPGSGQEYPVAVVRSPAGEAQETMHFPFGELELGNQLKTLQIALLRSGGKRRRAPSSEEQSVQNFGRALFDALLIGEVHSRYDVSQREAAGQGKGLRLKLRIQSPELAALPWEFLYDPRQAEYVCLSRNTPVVRYLELPRTIRPLSVTPPLRILGMVACPSDLPPLEADVAREKQRVEEAIKGLRASGLVEWTWLEGQTWRDLQREMGPTRGPWHIFHFIGHGGFDQNAEEGLIILADEEGKSYRLHATELSRLLADHRSLRLVLLNSCEGARGNERDIFSSTAATLIRRDIPAVLAMQYEITDQAAVEFASTFYRTLAEGMPVDTAVAEARKAVSLAVSNTMEWGTPVLYMRSPDGMLFNVQQAPVIKDKEQDEAAHKVQVEAIEEVTVQEAVRTLEQRVSIQEDIPGSAKEATPTSQGTSLERLEELYNRGLGYLHARSLEEAVADVAAFRELIGIDPSYKDAREKLDEAKERARKFENLEDFYRMGKAYSDMGQWGDAVACLKRIADSGEQYKNATVLLAEADKQLRLQILYTNAEAQLKETKWEKAIATLEEVVRIDPTYKGDSYNKLKRARAQYRLQSLYEQVLDHFHEEEWPEAIRKLRAILRKDPDYRDAADRLKEARRRQKLAALYRNGIGFQGTGRWEEAIEQFTEIIRLARVYKFGKYKDVVDKLAGVQRQQELYKRLKQGETYRRQGKWEEAEKEFEQVRTIDPNYQGVQAKLEECNKQLRLEELRAQEEASVRDQNWPKVVEVLEKLHELVPEDVNIITRLEEAKRRLELDRLYREAMEHIQKKRWRKAKAPLERVMSIDPGYRDAATQLETVQKNLKRIVFGINFGPSSMVVTILRDPLWQGIGGVVAIIALIIAAYPFVKGAFNPVTPTPRSATPKPATLCNGDFEKRNFECWEHGGELRQDVKCEGGQCFAVLGSRDYKCEGGVPVGEAWIKQSFQVPETMSPTLSLRYRVFSYDLDNLDFFQVSINGEPIRQFGNPEWAKSSCDREAWDSGWQSVGFDLSPYKGERVELSFCNANGMYEWWNTWTYVDDVEVH